MEGILLFAAAEIFAITALKYTQRQAQEQIVLKWKKGELTLEELYLLKARPWFQREVLRPPKGRISPNKKQN
jgi:hypothetical protein